MAEEHADGMPPHDETRKIGPQEAVDKGFLAESPETKTDLADLHTADSSTVTDAIGKLRAALASTDGEDRGVGTQYPPLHDALASNIKGGDGAISIPNEGNKEGSE